MAAAVELTEFHRHGGQLAAARARFPQAPEPWIDLSTGINPRPYPAPRIGRTARARLPDPQDLAALEAAAAAAFGAEPQRVAAVPGSELAIRLLPGLLDASSAAIAQSTYGSHSQAWAAAGARILEAPDEAQAWTVVNPNNPDGRVTPAEVLLASAQRRWTIVDEAYADLDPSISMAPRAAGRLIVLRSFGKFFGLAGVRLGFVVADEPLIARLRTRLGDWPVGADAIAAGLAAYRDVAWAERTRRRLRRDGARLERMLAEAGMETLGGTALFRLVRAPDAAQLFARLAAGGVLTRPFADGRRLRVGLPGSTQAWTRLAAALSGAAP